MNFERFAQKMLYDVIQLIHFVRRHRWLFFEIDRVNLKCGIIKLPKG